MLETLIDRVEALEEVADDTTSFRREMDRRTGVLAIMLLVSWVLMLGTVVLSVNVWLHARQYVDLSSDMVDIMKDQHVTLHSHERRLSVLENDNGQEAEGAGDMPPRVRADRGAFQASVRAGWPGGRPAP